MEPILSAGQALALHPLAGRPEPGEIVAVRSPEGLRIHRLVAWDGDLFLTQGDNLCEPDGWQGAESLLARVSPSEEMDGSAPRTAPLGTLFERGMVGTDPGIGGQAPAWGLRFFREPLRLIEATAAERASFVALCDRQGLRPWVGALLERGAVPADLVPRAQAALLAYRVNTMVARRRRQTQAEIMSAAERAGVPLISLKGLALGLLVYGDLAARSQWDIDLLVDPLRLADGQRLLAEIGFRPAENRGLASWYRHWHYDQRWSRLLDTEQPELAGEQVELHWDFTQPGTHRLDLAALLRRSVVLPAAPDLGPVLSPEDRLLTLGTHWAMDDRASSLRSLFEIATLAGDPTLNWSALVSRARDAGLRTALWLALDAAWRAFEAPVPDLASTALAPGARSMRLWRERLPLAALADRPDFASKPWRLLRWPTLFLPDRVAARGRRVALAAIKSVSRRITALGGDPVVVAAEGTIQGREP